MTQHFDTFDAPARHSALVAVASKEAAYISDWIFHHLRFGFAPILVLVNRSDDATETIVRRISRQDPRVRLLNVDSLDSGHPYTNKRIQLDAYETALQALRKELTPDSYMFCFDIDEFWTPKDFKSSIQDHLHHLGWPLKCALNWFVPTEGPTAFAPPFQSTLSGRSTVLRKHGFQIGQSIKEIRIHRLEDTNQLPTRLACGADSPADENRSAVPPTSLADAFLLHRMHRSVVEYVGLLGRPRPKAAELPFKSNRRGYFWIGRFETYTLDFHVAPDKLDAYHADSAEFMAQHALTNLTRTGRYKMLERASGVLRDFDALPKDVQAQWAHIFDDVDMETLPNVLLAEWHRLDLQKRKQQPDPVAQLRDEHFGNGGGMVGRERLELPTSSV